MLLKILAKILLTKRDHFLKLITVNGKPYIISLERYELADEYLRKCENALNTGNIQGVDNQIL